MEYKEDKKKFVSSYKKTRTYHVAVAWTGSLLLLALPQVAHDVVDVPPQQVQPGHLRNQ